MKSHSLSGSERMYTQGGKTTKGGGKRDREQMFNHWVCIVANVVLYESSKLCHGVCVCVCASTSLL
jgi:hypothetical protein